jgi:predicted aldo/keto reductase-like oxidoreductase
LDNSLIYDNELVSIQFRNKFGAIRKAKDDQEVENICRQILDKNPKTKIEVTDDFNDDDEDLERLMDEVLERLMEKYETVDPVYGPPPKIERPWI